MSKGVENEYKTSMAVQSTRNHKDSRAEIFGAQQVILSQLFVHSERLLISNIIPSHSPPCSLKSTNMSTPKSPTPAPSGKAIAYRSAQNMLSGNQQSDLQASDNASTQSGEASGKTDGKIMDNEQVKSENEQTKGEGEQANTESEQTKSKRENKKFKPAEDRTPSPLSLDD